MIILDCGSSTTNQNDVKITERMIDAIADSDPHVDKVVIKWQLFKDVLTVPGIGDIAPLDRELYLHADEYAWQYYGYETTASVFDVESLEYLLGTDPPFVKIACRQHCYGLLPEIPAGNDLVISVGNHTVYEYFKSHLPAADLLCCLPQYPANPTAYESMFSGLLHYGISDHTEGLYLYKKYRPKVYERHFCLEDSTGPDAASFAIRPKDLTALKELGND